MRPLTDDQIQLNPVVNLGMAVALDEGLIVPVIKDASSKSLKDISLEAALVAERAKTNKLQLDDVANGTFNSYLTRHVRCRHIHAYTQCTSDGHIRSGSYLRRR